MPNQEEYLKINYSKNNKSLHGRVASYEFENDGFQICYLPSLELSSYGKTIEEAREMMEGVIIKQFCEDLMSLPVARVLQELKSLGWNSSPFFKKELSKQSHIDAKGILRDLHLSEDTKIQQRILEVA